MERYFTDQRHERLRAQVRKFAEREVIPRIPEMESTRAVSAGLSRLIARQGWIG
ncbi:MAG: acyl-CoA dehydrogenase family protein, partial [Micromonosporaceae bacterium]